MNPLDYLIYRRNLEGRGNNDATNFPLVVLWVLLWALFLKFSPFMEWIGKMYAFFMGFAVSSFIPIYLGTRYYTNERINSFSKKYQNCILNSVPLTLLNLLYLIAYLAILCALTISF